MISQRSVYSESRRRNTSTIFSYHIHLKVWRGDKQQTKPFRCTWIWCVDGWEYHWANCFGPPQIVLPLLEPEMVLVLQQQQVLVEGMSVLDKMLGIDLELYLELYLKMVHLLVPPGRALLLVQMTCYFIPGHIMSKNEDKYEDTDRNTVHFQRIAN